MSLGQAHRLTRCRHLPVLLREWLTTLAAVQDVGTCCYDLVRSCVTARGWQLLESSHETARRAQRYHMYWTDRSVTRTRVSCLDHHQMINHFPGMVALTSKSQLAANLRKMQDVHPDDYDFLPESWVLPEDHDAFQRACRSGRERGNGAMFIVKPERGCQGRKIFLTDDPDDPAIAKAAWHGAMGGDALVAQRYIQNPLVFYSTPADKGYKFDLRLYVIVTSCNPLRIMLYRDGLARFCTEPYSKASADNKEWRYMHLTNFSLNRSNGNFAESVDPSDPKSGSKRRLSVLFDFLQAEGHDVARLWAQLEEMVAKSVLAVLPLLQHYYGLCKPGDKFGDRCIEVLGMDVLLDADLKPWLLEFNHSPSFHVSGPVDEAVKQPLITDILHLLAPVLEHRAAEFSRGTYSLEEEAAQRSARVAGVHGPGSHGLLKRMRDKLRDKERQRVRDWADEAIDAAAEHGQGTAAKRQQRQSLEEFALDRPRYHPPGADRCGRERPTSEEEAAWEERCEACEAPLRARMTLCYPPACPALRARYAALAESAWAVHKIAPPRQSSPARRDARSAAASAALDASDSDSEGPGPWDHDIGLSDSSESGPDSPALAGWGGGDEDVGGGAGSGSGGMSLGSNGAPEEEVEALPGYQRLLIRCAPLFFGIGILCPPLMLWFLPPRRP